MTVRCPGCWVFHPLASTWHVRQARLQSLYEEVNLVALLLFCPMHTPKHGCPIQTYLLGVDLSAVKKGHNCWKDPLQVVLTKVQIYTKYIMFIEIIVIGCHAFPLVMIFHVSIIYFVHSLLIWMMVLCSCYCPSCDILLSHHSMTAKCAVLDLSPLSVQHVDFLAKVSKSLCTP